jgi:hypothetical protein
VLKTKFLREGSVDLEKQHKILNPNNDWHGGPKLDLPPITKKVIKRPETPENDENHPYTKWYVLPSGKKLKLIQDQAKKLNEINARLEANPNMDTATRQML